ncbi:hypothetical protein NHL50_01865 [Acidimicrobiia bacterium EGI L10123]|mgnify:FL=1|uniref:hypothetical protein n=1 Tax=Salinilacustrithrix flava TaxID=2957203 RepID=UPI000E80ACA0|nr:hypothetical protein [Acidimicrobiia bacterium EGI L10123]HAS09458.1 hypothetical protein [Acidimicrobiaceae bacterium]
MASDPLVEPIEGGEHQSFAGIDIDLFAVGDARVKRLVYGVGGKWSEHVKPHVGTDFCEHAHVGFLAKGRLAGEYPDGCTFDFTAPIGVHIDPGHDSWVVGDEPAVLIEIDFGPDTVERLGIPGTHSH